jgi:mannose-6-phosphate isomerase
MEKSKKQLPYLETDKRPWGEYFVMEDEATYKVKRILVEPNKRLSLQSHKKREEVWVAISGTPTVEVGELGNLKKFDLKIGESCKVPLGAVHRLSNENSENVAEIIEVQTGTYFGEDDIVRYEDDFNRV